MKTVQQPSGTTLGNSVAVIAYYGIRTETLALAEAYEQILGWFESLGHSPNVAGVSAPGYSDNAVSFEAVAKRIAKTGFDRIEGFEIAEVLPHGYVSRDYWITTSVSRDTADAVLAIDEHLCSFSRLGNAKIFHDLLATLRPSYAVGFAKERQFGPTLYAAGIPHGLADAGVDYEVRRNISRWLDTANPAQVFRRGLLRDVYQLNLLNDSQLHAKVDGGTLRDWIQIDPKRGRLQTAEMRLTRWDVPADNLEEVRQPLWDAGVIFDWRRHAER